MPLNVPTDSRLAQTQTILFGEVETYGKWNQPSLLTRVIPDEDLIFFTVDNSNQGRPDLIANEVYDNTLLDWLVIAFNSPRDVLNWPRTGTTIRLPSPTLVSSEIL